MAAAAALSAAAFASPAAPAGGRAETLGSGTAATERPQFRHPSYLRAGDTVAVVSTSGRVSEHCDTARIRSLIESWGLHVEFGRHCTDRSHPYFAGSDSMRAADLQRAIDNPNIKAIIACRGGYGMVRLLPSVDFKPLFIHPKWIVGFSDITMLHRLMNNAGIESLHGPMPETFTFDDDGNPDSSAESLRPALFGELHSIGAEPHPLNRTGHAEGRLAGGNLTILAATAGTPEALSGSDPTILFIEEVGEAAYRIDRMMQQLLRSGALDNVTAIVAGHFTDTQHLDRFGVESAYEIIDEYARRMGIPAMYGFPAGHELPNTAFYLGRYAAVDITDEGASLTFTEQND